MHPVGDGGLFFYQSISQVSEKSKLHSIVPL